MHARADDVSTALGWTMAPPEDTFCLIRDQLGSPGDLVLHSLLSVLFSTPKRTPTPSSSSSSSPSSADVAVLLLAVRYDMQHYTAVGKKLGLRMKQLQRASRLRVVEVMALPEGDVASLRALYVRVRDEVRQLAEAGRRVFVVVDDATLLLSLYLGAPEAAVSMREFLPYCGKLEEVSSVFAVVHQDVEDAVLRRALVASEARADLIVEVSELDTGVSSVADGQMVVFRRSEDHLWTPEPVRLFKRSEMGIEVFRPGTRS